MTLGHPSLFSCSFGLISFFSLLLRLLVLFAMHFSRTLILVTDKLLHGKNREDICAEIVAAFAPVTIQAVQIGASQVRVTFYDSETCKTVKTRTEIEIFGTKCKILGGGPPPTIVHLFDLPVEADDDGIKAQLSSCGKIMRISRQSYVKSPEVLTGTRIVVMHLNTTPPRSIMVGGYLCRIWYKGQPLECNICGSSGHKAANCPNKDKCKRCGAAGHFVRDCPTPWRNASAPKPPAENSNTSDFPPLNSSSASLGAVPTASSSSSAQLAAPSTEADTALASSSSSNPAPVAPTNLVPLMSISVPPPLLSDHPSSLPPPPIFLSTLARPLVSSRQVPATTPIWSPMPRSLSPIPHNFLPLLPPPSISTNCDFTDYINEHNGTKSSNDTESNSKEINGAKGTDNVIVINEIEKESDSSTVVTDNVIESEKIESNVVNSNGVTRDPDTVNNNIDSMELKPEHENESNESNFSQTNVSSQSSLFSTPSSQSVVESSLTSMVLDPSQGDAVLDPPSDHVSPSPSLKRKLSPEGVVIPTKKVEVDVIDKEPSPTSP